MKKALIAAKHLSEALFVAGRYIKNKKDFLLRYFGVFGSNRIELRKGGMIKVRQDSTDHYTIHEIIVRDDYRVRKGDIGGTILDIGANIGVFSAYCAILYPKSTIYSYEPVPTNYKMLESNTKKYSNVKCFKYLVMSKSGKGRITLSEENEGKHSVDFDGDHNMITARATTLKDILIKNKISEVSLLKMDVEGSEYDIFYNTGKDILAKIKKIHMEYHDSKENKGKDLAEYLRDAGFEVEQKKAFLTNHGYLYCHR